MTQNFLSLSQLTKPQLEGLINLALQLKQKTTDFSKAFNDETMVMIFQKPSNRTRLSFEIGFKQLGGYPIMMSDTEIGMGKRESIPDIAKTISRFTDMVMIRSLSHADIEEFAENASVPVINGLSDLYHPCQALADLLTIKENKNTLEAIKIAYIGDPNNVFYSLLKGCEILQIPVAIACPEGYLPIETPENLSITHNPMEAAQNADVIYTDVWTSMGQEAESEKRKQDFANFQVTESLMNAANPEAIFLHCLPAHRGEEVSTEVLEGHWSKVFDQAENRLHAQKAIMLLTGGKIDV